ncbi:hypothetical protein UFOVP250_15 [uncultured Caudovirales phage]|uniref:Uncharacterized protein n=1 Tax=uncultured Caudovirales phage TaxID=2100421 RepID=A0A6J5LMI4_9CAUD|nr:hypothetical protein UFOVP250_15 [uncultured Caudovirales phage]
MALINNASGIYNTLGYNFSDPNGYIHTLSDNTQAHLNSMPPFIQPWQAQDIKDGTANDPLNYIYNPVANVMFQIESAAIQISTAIRSDNVTSLMSMASLADSLWATANSFYHHTNRISGVESFTNNDSVPHYDTAMAYGRTAMYITNQTDAITNTSPILGSFTSLLITPQISVLANTITIDGGLVANNVSPGILFGSGSTSLTAGQISQINSDMSNTISILSTRQNSDNTYYNNLKTFVSSYNNTRKFVDAGETANYLINNFIGKPHLINNLSS